MEEFVKADPKLKVVDGQIVNGEILRLESHVPPQYICSAIRDVECPICGYACSSASASRQQQLKAVKNHMNSNKLHQVSTEKSADFPFGCKDCNLFFRWEVHLSGHQTTVEAARTLERLEQEAQEAERNKLPRYTKNQRIEGNYVGGVKWFGGVIQKVNKDGTYHLKYDDGDIEESVSPKRIRYPPDSKMDNEKNKNGKGSNNNNNIGNDKRKNDSDVRDDSKDDVVMPPTTLFASEQATSLPSTTKAGKDVVVPKKKRGRPAGTKNKRK